MADDLNELAGGIDIATDECNLGAQQGQCLAGIRIKGNCFGGGTRGQGLIDAAGLKELQGARKPRIFAIRCLGGKVLAEGFCRLVRRYP